MTREEAKRILQGHTKLLWDPDLVNTVDISINGILTWAYDSKSWVDKREQWILQHHLGVQPIRLEYTCAPGPVWRTLKSEQMRKKLVILVAAVRVYYPRARIRLNCHSNGGDIVCDALSELQDIEVVVIVAGAVEHDFSKNNLGRALSSGQLQRVLILCSQKDWVLQGPARLSREVCGVVGHEEWAYGYMGWLAAFEEREPEMHLDPQWLASGRVRIVPQNWQGHGGYFSDEFFPGTMKYMDEA